MAIRGTKHDDILDGTAGDDLFKLGQGGDDTADGSDGDDTFKMKGMFTAADSLDGGADEDVLVLKDDYSTVVIFGAATITNIETIHLAPGYPYSLTTHDANVAAGETLTLRGGSLGPDDHVIFDGSAELDGRFVLIAGAGNDVLTGGARRDKFHLDNGGNDTVSGGAGNDVVYMGVLAASDAIDGGGGYDILKLTGVIGSDAITFSATTVTGIDRIVVVAVTGTSIETHEATVAAGETLELDMSGVANSADLDGIAETDGHFNVTGGTMFGTIAGGALSDTIVMSAHSSPYAITGRGGMDDITCNSGTEFLNYGAASESAGTGRDVIHAFDADVDKLNLHIAITNFEDVIDFVEVNEATFDDDLGNAISDELNSNDAWIVSANGGDLDGHDFLVVDVDGNADYTAGADYVFDITGFTGTLDASDFI